MAITKSTEVSNAPSYPNQRHNARERVVIKTANSFTPSVSGNWDSPSSITDQDLALDALAARGGTNETRFSQAAEGVGKAMLCLIADHNAASANITDAGVSMGVQLPAKAIIVACHTESLSGKVKSGDTSGTFAVYASTDKLSGDISLTDSAGDDFDSTRPTTSKLKVASATNVSLKASTGKTVDGGTIRVCIEYFLGQ